MLVLVLESVCGHHFAKQLGESALCELHPRSGGGGARSNQLGGSYAARCRIVGIGFEDRKEEVIIYVTKGSRKALAQLPGSIDETPVRAEVMGRLRAGPRIATAHAGISHLFEHNGRIACASSCAPSGEQYSGILGAFLKDEDEIFAISNNHVFAACNHTPVGMLILAGSTMDAKPGSRLDGLRDLASEKPIAEPMLAVLHEGQRPLFGTPL